MTITTTQAESQQPINTASATVTTSFPRIVPEYNLIDHRNCNPSQSGIPAPLDKLNARKHTQKVSDIDKYRCPNLKQCNCRAKESKTQEVNLATEDVRCESSTQTLEVTNLNVISNVKLSQSTLDSIFSQVMTDLQTKLPEIVNARTKLSNTTCETSYAQNFVPTTPKIVQEVVQKKGIDKTPERKQIDQVKYDMCESNPRVGDKSNRSSRMYVSMYPVLMKASSIELNSCTDNERDNDSDDNSLVDSLEGSVYPESNAYESYDKRVLEDTAKSNRSNWKRKNEPTTFFIPIEVTEGTELKSVSEHLPERLRDRLIRRNQMRQQRQLKRKSRQVYNKKQLDGSLYGDRISLKIHNSFAGSNLSKKKFKPLLPSIEPNRRAKGHEQTIGTTKNEKRVQENKKTKQACFNQKEKDRDMRNFSPISTSKKRIIYGSRRKVYDVNESSKRVQVFNVVECCSPVQEVSHESSLGKSKIPILINQKQPKGPIDMNIREQDAPDSTKQTHDSKIDQLIANILISTQRISDSESAGIPSSSASRSHLITPSSCKGHNCCQEHNIKSDQSERTGECQMRSEHEAINTKESLNDSALEKSELNKDNDNNDHDAYQDDDARKSPSWNAYKGRTAIEVIGDENFLTIPKGWITFYMLHESAISPGSNSDEGKQEHLSPKECTDDCAISSSPKVRTSVVTKTSRRVHHPVNLRNKQLIYEPTDRRTTEQRSSIGINIRRSNAIEYKSILPSLTNGNKLNQCNEQKRSRCNINNNRQSELHQNEWYITVSGDNSSKRYPSNLEMHLKVSEYTNNDNDKSISSGSEDCICDRSRICFPRIDPKLNNELTASHKSRAYQSHKPSDKQLPYIPKGNF